MSLLMSWKIEYWTGNETEVANEAKRGDSGKEEVLCDDV